jgi:putative restriction endonuclease
LRRTITYADLGARIGVHHRAIRYVLGPIQDYCR